MASHFSVYVNGIIKRFAVATHEQAIAFAWTGATPKPGDECVTAPARARMGVKWVRRETGWVRAGSVALASLKPSGVSRETYERVRAKVRALVARPGVGWAGQEWSPGAEGVLYAPSFLDGKPQYLVNLFKSAGLAVEPAFYGNGDFYGFLLTERCECAK